jgi:hypothetical protein
MAEIFADEGLCLYLPDSDEPTRPYWKAFMAMAIRVDNMDISMENEDMAVFRDKKDNVIGVQMPEPVDNNGAPVEEVVNFLSSVLCPDDVDDIVDHVSEAKKVTNNLQTNGEFMTIVENLMTEEIDPTGGK